MERTYNEEFLLIEVRRFAHFPRDDSDAVITRGVKQGQLSERGEIVELRRLAWSKHRADLTSVLVERGGVLALRFRRPRRGLLGMGKPSQPLTSEQMADVRTFASKLALELALTTNVCQLRCEEGHSWFVVTFA